MRTVFALALSLAAVSPTSADSQITGVIELFTSQGCSSCPPADALLEVLAQRPDLAVLSLPVDYWDRLGWKDTYGSPAHSARQRAYATTRNDRSVYTPQVVVNGTHHMNGADRSEIESNLELLRSRLSVAVDITRANGVLRIAIGPTSTAAASSVRSATVVIMPYLARREVAIGRGENAKRQIAYTNIVRDIQNAGQWTGEARTFEIPLAALNGADGAVVVLQTGNLEKPGPVIGAAQIAVAAAP